MNTKTIIGMLLMIVVIFCFGCAKVAENSAIDLDGGYGDPTAQKMMPSIGANTRSYEVDDVEYNAEFVEEKSMILSEPMPPVPEPYGDPEYEISQKIIKNANINIEVEDYFLASQKVEGYAKKYGGYVSNSDVRSGREDKYSGTITIRIPEMHYDAVLAELQLLGDVTSKNSYGNDVTEEYIDVKARIDNSEAHEKRLVNMFSNASDVKEMMQIERELSRVREDIERNKGRLRYMENRVSMSTVSVYLYEEVPVVKEWGVVRSIKNAVNNFLGTLRFLIELLGFLLPLIVVGSVVGIVVWLVRRNGKKKSRR